jgi:hypothetical protein
MAKKRNVSYATFCREKTGGIHSKDLDVDGKIIQNRIPSQSANGNSVFIKCGGFVDWFSNYQHYIMNAFHVFN